MKTLKEKMSLSKIAKEYLFDNYEILLIMKICFTSALFCEPQDFNKLDKPGHFKRNKNYDYFLFTNLNSYV